MDLKSHRARTTSSSDLTRHDAVVVVLALIVSAVVGAVIFGYGVAVRHVGLGAGLSKPTADFLAVLACVPIIVALYALDS